MKVADHTLLTPFISADRQTGRQGKCLRVAELLQITAFPSPHQACQASNHRPGGFFTPTSPPLLPPTTRSRATLIGSGEFKIPDCDWDCHRPGQHCKATTYPSYHRAAQQSRKPDSGYCLANGTVYFTHRCARITQLWLIGREGTNVWITVVLLLPPMPGKRCLMQDLVFDMGNLLKTVNYGYHCWCSRGYCRI